MSKLFWFLNAGLLLLAVLISFAVSRYQPARRLDLNWNKGELGKERIEATAKSGDFPPDASLNLPNSDPEVLWKNSLFRPDRTEDLESLSLTTADTATPVSEMELVGIAIIGNDAAAIILLQNRSAPLQSLRNKSPGKDSKEKPVPVKHIYRLGQPVGESGYTLKEIRMTEIVLVRGEEERILKLDRGDATSKTRNDSAAKEAATRPPPLPPTPPLPVAGGNIPPPPPPPPPLVSDAGSGPNTQAGSSTSKEDRIKAALEARRRILERRQTSPEGQVKP